MKVIDLAQAIAPNAEIDEIGIRPGEKLHEVLISEDEARNTVEIDTMFIVKPPETLWERSLDYAGKALPAGFRYSSETNSMWLDAQGIRELVAPFERLEAATAQPERHAGTQR
jgi:UDP-N-acetylglucosamine 4,6-dehydratase